MKKEEAQFIQQNIQKLIEKKGMPVNIRNGSNEEIAKWFGKILDDNAKIDEPLGTVDNKCPICRHTIGSSGFFCKWCGAMLREALY